MTLSRFFMYVLIIRHCFGICLTCIVYLGSIYSIFSIFNILYCFIMWFESRDLTLVIALSLYHSVSASDFVE